MISERIKKYLPSALAAAGIAMASIAGSASSAWAQCGEVPCPTVGQIKCCPGQSISILQQNGGIINFTATTNGCFMITSCTPPPPCNWQVVMAIQNFTGTGTDPVLGTVQWRNDPTRPSTGSTITSYSNQSQFPAIGTISLYVEAEIAGVPGIYRSDREVVLTNRQVMSWDPFVHETFTTDPNSPPVVFTNNISGNQFTLNQLTSILN